MSCYFKRKKVLENEEVRKDIEDLIRRAKENHKKNIEIILDKLLNLNDACFKLHTRIKRLFLKKC